MFVIQKTFDSYAFEVRTATKPPNTSDKPVEVVQRAQINDFYKFARCKISKGYLYSSEKRLQLAFDHNK